MWRYLKKNDCRKGTDSPKKDKIGVKKKGATKGRRSEEKEGKEVGLPVPEPPSSLRISVWSSSNGISSNQRAVAPCHHQYTCQIIHL